MKLVLDLDKIRRLATVLPDLADGTPVPPLLQPYVQYAPLAPKLINILGIFAESEVQDPFSCLGLEMGPVGKGHRDYLRSREMWTDDDVSAAVLTCLYVPEPEKGKPDTYSGLRDIMQRVNSTLNFHLRTVHKTSISDSSAEQLRTSVDAILSDDCGLDDVTQCRLGDLLNLTLKMRRKAGALEQK